ncbi:MAG: PQQ-binding-like beta-propeller repeat protein, partial [Candidatus Eremiobacteraeota bacterium]|nr:PQQ-binding-like beta-propeller repeat protein [Candidatus Eremiobacteraeota bacterium]
MSRFQVFYAAVVCTTAFCASGASAADPSTFGWPQLLHDAAHSSVSTNAKLSAATASTIGIHWMSAMRSADIGSPVSATNATLNKTAAYVGDERGDVLAFDEATGASLWATSVGYNNSERSSPLIAPDGSVWVATAYSPTLSKLDGSTGSVLCTVKVPLRMDASIMLATPPGGVETVYFAANHTQTNGPEYAATESNCQPIWSYDKWLTLSGAWATPAFGIDASGKGRVFIGTADPDSTMYSLDALTGKELWHYSALNPPDGTYDVGAAATVSAPGNNGFADGVLYFPSKYGVMYALDMMTGKVIWQYNFNAAAHVTGGGRSAAALDGNMLVYGMADGVEAVNATTGALLWHYSDPAKQEVLSSPAIAGPPGEQIVTFGDATGLFTVLRLADGKVLYNYQTGNYITSSPAIVNGHILIASTDGFLYDFATGGGNVAPPVTTLVSPKTGSQVANPSGGVVTVTGTASDSVGLTAVQLSVQMGGPSGPWYDATTGTWVAGAFDNIVPVTHPHWKQSTWSLALPVPTAGSTYQVFANAVDLGGQADRVGVQTSFAVKPVASGPQLTLSSPLVAPASNFTASGGPFAANETVDFALQGKVLAHGTASSAGIVPATTIPVPGSAGFGQSALSATGETSHEATTAAVDVTNVWTQVGYDATHSGYEPNDSILSDTLQSTHYGFLGLAWQHASGAAIDASIAVVGGSAYVGNTAGMLSAVDTASGAPFWTYEISSQAAIDGAPAVGNGDVVFGANDGNIYRVAATTGKPIGSEQLDGVPTAPALANGTIYAATDNGTVYAIDEATGNQPWSTAVGAAIHQSPSIDTVAGILIVGDDAGNVTTLKLTTGAEVGQVSTGGATVTVAPVVSSGKVLVGAADGKVRAFDETSRALDWTYTAGSSIGALAADGKNVYVGGAAGTFADITEATGGYVFVGDGFKSAVIGIGHSAGVSV